MGNKQLSAQSEWESFWKNNPTGFDTTMEQSTIYFAERVNEVFPIQSNDHFLDIGCGPGFFIDQLKDKCEAIHGTDISATYIELAKIRFQAYPQLSFETSKVYDFEAYALMAQNHQINKVVMLSVLQYYQNLDQIAALILSLKKVGQAQKISFLLADIIPEQHSTFSDIASIIKHAFKKRYTLQFVKFLGYALFSDYSKVKKNGLLKISPSFFEELGKQHQLDVQIIKNLTLHTGRYSVMVSY